MIKWEARFSAVLHANGIFMFIFLELIFNCVFHPCQKKTDYHKFLKFTNSSPDASDGRDHQQFMFLHDWKVPLPHPQQERLRLISDFFSSIAGKLLHIQPENFCSYLYPRICICFVFSSRIPHKKIQISSNTFTSLSESA